MTIEITPGLDFGVKDVPTHESLIEQAKSIRITNIPIDQLDSDVAVILTGPDSGVSGAILESTEVGTIWTSPDGEIFVQESSGAVKITRRGGGWDSRRYYAHENSGVAARPHALGAAVQVRPLTQKAQHEHFFRSNPSSLSGATNWVSVTHQRPDQDTGNDGILHGLLQETCTSGYRTWNGRGVSHLQHYGSGIYDITIRQTYPFGRGDGGNVQWLFMGSNQSLTSPRVQCLLLGMTSDSSLTTDGNFGMWGAFMRNGYTAWNPGPPMMFNRNPGAF